SCGGGWTWLERATRGGADAIGLGGLTGEIAEGSAADFLLVDLEVAELAPSWDLPWELVRTADRDQITAVAVGGRLRLWRGRPVDWGGGALLVRAGAAGRAAVQGAPIARAHPVATEHRARGGAR